MDTAHSLKKRKGTAPRKVQGRWYTAENQKKLFLSGAADIVDSAEESDNQPQWQRKGRKFRNGNIGIFFNNDVIQKYALGLLQNPFIGKHQFRVPIRHGFYLDRMCFPLQRLVAGSPWYEHTIKIDSQFAAGTTFCRPAGLGKGNTVPGSPLEVRATENEQDALQKYPVNGLFSKANFGWYRRIL